MLATADTGWHNDKPMTPLGLGCTDFRSGSRMAGVPSRRAGKEGVLKRRFSFQLNSNISSSSDAAAAPFAGKRLYRLYRNEFEAMRMGEGRFTCRSQSENTDVGDAQDVMKKEKDNRLLNKKGLNSVAAANGAPSAVHVNGSLDEKAKAQEEDDALAVAASRSWWDRIPRRYIIVGLCFIAFLLCNMDRVCSFSSSPHSLMHVAHLVGFVQQNASMDQFLLVTIWSP